MKLTKEQMLVAALLIALGSARDVRSQYKLTPHYAPSATQAEADEVPREEHHVPARLYVPVIAATPATTMTPAIRVILQALEEARKLTIHTKEG